MTSLCCQMVDYLSLNVGVVRECEEDLWDCLLPPGFDVLVADSGETRIHTEELGILEFPDVSSALDKISTVTARSCDLELEVLEIRSLVEATYTRGAYAFASKSFEVLFTENTLCEDRWIGSLFCMLQACKEQVQIVAGEIRFRGEKFAGHELFGAMDELETFSCILIEK